ncbi:hypothetical protein CNY89_23305, partial [Amaricoccus sp. HAR-UPW-R2A-40]
MHWSGEFASTARGRRAGSRPHRSAFGPEPALKSGSARRCAADVAAWYGFAVSRARPQALTEPFAEIHPADAEARGVGPADLVEVTSPHGRAIVRALVTDRVQPGDVF